MKTLLILIALITLNGCNDADVASRNLSKAADNFEVVRRTVFYNGITDKYILTIQGKCSLDTISGRLEVVCKVKDGKYKKHYLGLSDNVTYFSEQIDGSKASVSQYRVIFKPSVIIPEAEIR